MQVQQQNAEIKELIQTRMTACSSFIFIAFSKFLQLFFFITHSFHLYELCFKEQISHAVYNLWQILFLVRQLRPSRAMSN